MSLPGFADGDQQTELNHTLVYTLRQKSPAEKVGVNIGIFKTAEPHSH